MSKWRGLSALAAALLVGLVVAVPAHGANEVTVAQFIENLARNWKIEAADASSALDALNAAGVRTPSGLDLRKPLTEGDVVAFAAAMNLRLSTAHPEQVFTDDQMDRFFAVFGTELGLRPGSDGSEQGRDDDDDGNGPPDGWPGNGNGPPFDPFSKGKGKGKGNVSPTDP